MAYHGGAKEAAMKTLIVLYSYKGNSALVAQELQKALGEGCHVLPLRFEDETYRSRFTEYLRLGKLAFSRSNPKLMPCEESIDDYDLLIFGGPVWAGSPAPALRSFIAETKPAGKRTGVFLCHAGKPGKALDKLKALLEGNTIEGQIDFVNPEKQDRAAVAQKVRDWVRACRWESA
jgi:flavodoxin